MMIYPVRMTSRNAWQCCSCSRRRPVAFALRGHNDKVLLPICADCGPDIAGGIMQTRINQAARQQAHGLAVVVPTGTPGSLCPERLA